MLLSPVLHAASGPDQVLETLALVLGLYLIFFLYLSGPDRSRIHSGSRDPDEEEPGPTEPTDEAKGP